MHVCDEFRERITEQIIDRQDLEKNVEFQRELLVCNSCSDFYSESREMIEAMSAVKFELPEQHWELMADRMRTRILEDQAARSRVSWLKRLGLSGWRSFRPYIPATAGVVAMLLMSVGVYRLAVPVINPSSPTGPVPSAIVASPDPNLPLDPVTVEFLEQSELLLRTVMKLEPASVEDLEQAQKIAGSQLVEIDQRKEAASDVLPVVSVMDKYEMILREIRNLHGPTMAEDISDIQNRIEKNGLIASMKSFQPKVTVVDSDLGIDH
jgi:hypothetical protein